MSDPVTPAQPAAPVPSPSTPSSPPAPPAEPVPAAAPAVDPAVAQLKARNDQLSARLIREAVKAAAIPHGLVEPALINDLPLSGVTIDENGTVRGEEVAVTNLRANYPGMFGRSPAPAPAPVQSAPVPTYTPPQSIAAVPAAPAAPAGQIPSHKITREEWRNNKAGLIADAKKRMG